MPRGAKTGGHRKRGGRVKGQLNCVSVEVRELARNFGPEALRKAVSIMRSAKTTAQAKMMAINAILDRAYGKPHVSQEISLTGDLHIEGMSDRQLAALVARLDGGVSADEADQPSGLPN